MAIVLLAIASSFVSIAGLINEAKEAARHVKLWYLGLASATIVVSWCCDASGLHAALRARILSAAQKRATEEKPAASCIGGLDFPGEPNPDYWDFLYFATSIGATSQTSDVAIRSRALRRLVTVHAVVSFFFNATVLALTINLAAGPHLIKLLLLRHRSRSDRRSRRRGIGRRGTSSGPHVPGAAGGASCHPLAPGTRSMPIG